MLVLSATKNGLVKAYKLCLKLFKIIIPVYFLVAILDYSGLLKIISNWFEGIMFLFGLPGKAALALLLANGINIYASIAAIDALSFTTKEITILAIMICICHSLPVETTILKGLKIPRFLQITLRLSVSLLTGFILNLLWR